MHLPLLAALFLGLLWFGYWRYGRWIGAQMSFDDANPTPAVRKNDGVDFIPTKKFYLFGQHFSAIAAAGPIAGPIVACQMFGWLPSLLWIGIGVIFIGAVHDFVTLFASVRHDSMSVAEIARERISSSAGRLMIAFIWIALVYIIIAFVDITAGSFVSRIEELDGVSTGFNPGGAVAAASLMYLLLSLVLGLVQRFLNPPLWAMTVVFVPLAFLTSWAGTWVSEMLVFDHLTWVLLILVYCGVGSVTPLWLLLQPRGFLGGFILYFALFLGVVGIFFGGFPIQQSAVKATELSVSTTSMLPFLFVTIACGACSGFHGLVCSGTTSKQIEKESHTEFVGYGAMLAEAFVAFVALAVVMIASDESLKGLKPGTIYGNGIGQFLTLLIGEEHRQSAITFGAMAFSTFVFDTLDVSARLGRYLLQELTGMKGRLGAVVGTILTLLVPALILVTSEKVPWTQFWTLFGASNQLLAALTLLCLSIWLKEEGKSSRITFYPMILVAVVTLWALFDLAVVNFLATQGFDVAFVNLAASLALIGIASSVFYMGLKRYLFS